MKGLMMKNHVPLGKMWLVSRMPIFIVTINSTSYIYYPSHPLSFLHRAICNPWIGYSGWAACMNYS